MQKLIFLGLLLVSSSVFAQECNQIGWSNHTILSSALDAKAAEMMDVNLIKVDTKKEMILFSTTSSAKPSYFTYKTCGENITFSEVRKY